MKTDEQTTTDETRYMGIYLGRAEFAQRIGVKPDTLNRYTLPEPDEQIGKRKFWLESTVDRWNAERPGRGWWGEHGDRGKGKTEGSRREPSEDPDVSGVR